MPLNLVLSNKPSSLNKKLIKFFQLNLLSLNKASLIFQFEVAHPDNSNKYVSRGIKNYPVLIHDKTNIVGVEKIIEYLKVHVQKHNTKVLSKTDTDHIDDFWKQTLGNVKVNEAGQLDDDDDNDDSNDLHKKIQQAFQERNDSTELNKTPKNSRQNNVQQSPVNIPRSNTINNSNDSDESPSSTLKNMNSKSGNMDDDLMAKFFENQEESN